MVAACGKHSYWSVNHEKKGDSKNEKEMDRRLRRGRSENSYLKVDNDDD